MDAPAASALFDANARTYDRVNSLISLGLDAGWRRWVARQAVTHPGARVLDAFAGTGLVGIEAAVRGAEVTLADTSRAMLDSARSRAAERGVEVRDVVVDLAARHLPFRPASFDAITVSFGVRYLDDPRAVLRRLGALLVPGGRLVVLEFVRPEGGPVTSAASLYFFRLLPRVATRLAGHGELYAYLTESTERIGHFRDLVQLVEDAGFEIAAERRMGFGIVAGLVCVP